MSAPTLAEKVALRFDADSEDRANTSAAAVEEGHIGEANAANNDANTLRALAALVRAGDVMARFSANGLDSHIAAHADWFRTLDALASALGVSDAD